MKVTPWIATKHDPRKDETFGIIVFGVRDGKIRLAHASAVEWDAWEETHRAFRAWWAKVRDQPKYHGWIEYLTPADLAGMLPSTTKGGAA
jgi:hypothetical protein